MTFTATVTGGGNPVTPGTVTFRDGTTVLATIALDGSGEATFTTSALAVGDHTITATFNGNDELRHEHQHAADADGQPDRHDDGARLVATPRSTFGEAVTFTATVTGGGNPVTVGTVTFRDGTTVLATIALDGSGQATLHHVDPAGRRHAPDHRHLQRHDELRHERQHPVDADRRRCRRRRWPVHDRRG